MKIQQAHQIEKCNTIIQNRISRLLAPIDTGDKLSHDDTIYLLSEIIWWSSALSQECSDIMTQV